jgi:hypothetical protein
MQWLGNIMLLGDDVRVEACAPERALSLFYCGISQHSRVQSTSFGSFILQVLTGTVGEFSWFCSLMARAKPLLRRALLHPRARICNYLDCPVMHGRPPCVSDEAGRTKIAP